LTLANTPLNSIRKSILNRKGIKLAPKTKRPITQDEVVTPFHKTSHMKLLELKHSKPIDTIIWEGTIDDVARKYSIDRSTVSKWRKRITEDIIYTSGIKFFDQFEGD